MEKSAKLIIASGENDSNMKYATGISTPDDFICFIINEEKFALFSPLEYSRAKAEANDDLNVIAEDTVAGNSFAQKIISFAKEKNVDSFIVPCNFPLYFADAIRDSGIVVRAVNEPFFDSRKFKTPEEIEKITESQRAAEASLYEAIKTLEESSIDSNNSLIYNGKELTSEKLRFIINSKLLEFDMVGTNTICAGGIQSSQPHNCGSGVLKANSPIVMDIFPKSNIHGYWGDLTRTLVKGKVPNIVNDAYNAVKEARDAAISEIEIGVSSEYLHNLAMDILKKNGFDTGKKDGIDYGFFHSLGHGVGLDIHEQPRISVKSSYNLRGGEVFSIEPGLYYSQWGGIRLEDLIYLNPNGSVENLTKAETKIEV